MNNTPARAALLGAAVVTLVLCGCRRPGPAVRIVALRDASQPVTYTVRFRRACYDRDAAGDLRFAAHARSQDPDSSTTVEQFFWVELTWVPIPGKTYDDPSSINATLEYVIRTPAGQARYIGTGFAYPYRQRFGDAIRLSIERAELRLEQRRGDVPDLLGDARLTGTLIARPDAAGCIDLRRQMQIEPLTKPD